VIVIDTSALSRFLMRETGWQDVVPYLDPDVQPLTVEMLFTEATNIVWKYVMKKFIDENEGMEFYGDLIDIYESKTITIEKNMKYSKSALEIGFTHNIAIYDALFLSQAHENHATLITCDRQQANIADKLNIQVELM
jgi:predicted nucleic acid-binding protein